MPHPSNISLLLRPDAVAEQLSKEARLKRLQQVREAEKAASKAQRARYQERKGKVTKTERISEKVQWEHQHQHLVEKTAHQLSSRLQFLGEAHKSATTQYQQLKAKQCERENAIVEHIIESRLRATEAELALKQEASIKKKEIEKARQQKIIESRNAAQSAGREKAHRKLEQQKALSMSERKQAVVQTHSMPITLSAETHPLGTSTGGVKLIDFSRTRLHATVTKYPSLGGDAENSNPSLSNRYPTPHNIAKQVIAEEPNRRRIQEESERRRNHAIDVRSEKAIESVQLQRVASKVENAFKTLAEKERQARLQDARDGITHHRSAMATIADLTKQKQRQESRRESVVESWFKDPHSIKEDHPSQLDDAFEDSDVSIVPNRVHDSVYTQELNREDVRRHTLCEPSPSADDMEPQALPSWVEPNHMPLKPTLPRWNSPTKPLSPPNPPAVSVPDLQWETPMEVEEPRSKPMPEPTGVLSTPKKRVVEHTSITSMGDNEEEEKTTIDEEVISNDVPQCPTTTDTFTIIETTQVLDTNSISNNANSSDDTRSSVPKDLHSQEHTLSNKTISNEEGTMDRSVDRSVGNMADESMSLSETSEEPSRTLDQEEENMNTSVSASILQQPFNLSALEVEINRSKAYLEASKVLAQLTDRDEKRGKAVVFNYDNSSDGSHSQSSSDSSFSDRYEPVQAGKTYSGSSLHSNGINTREDVTDLTPSPGKGASTSLSASSYSDLPNPHAVLESFRRSRQDYPDSSPSVSGRVNAVGGSPGSAISSPLPAPLELVDPLIVSGEIGMFGSQLTNLNIPPLTSDSLDGGVVSSASSHGSRTPPAAHAHISRFGEPSADSVTSSHDHMLPSPSTLPRDYETKEVLVVENQGGKSSQSQSNTSISVSQKQDKAPGVEMRSEAVEVDEEFGDDNSDSLSFGYLSTDEGPVFAHNLITLPLNENEFSIDFESHHNSSLAKGYEEVQTEDRTKDIEGDVNSASELNDSELRDIFNSHGQISATSLHDPNIAALERMLNTAPKPSPLRGTVRAGVPASSEHASSTFSVFSGLEGLSMASSLTLTVKSMEDMEKADMDGSSYDAAESYTIDRQTQDTWSQFSSPKRSVKGIESRDRWSSRISENSSSGSWSSDENVPSNQSNQSNKKELDKSHDSTDVHVYDEQHSSQSLSSSSQSSVNKPNQSRSFDPRLASLQEQQQIFRAQVERNRKLMTALDDMSSASSDNEGASYDKSRTLSHSLNVTQSNDSSDTAASYSRADESTHIDVQHQVNISASQEEVPQGSLILGEALSMMAELNMDPMSENSAESESNLSHKHNDHSLILDQADNSEDEADSDNELEETTVELLEEVNEDNQDAVIREDDSYSAVQSHSDGRNDSLEITASATASTVLHHNDTDNTHLKHQSMGEDVTVGYLQMSENVTYSMSREVDAESSMEPSSQQPESMVVPSMSKSFQPSTLIDTNSQATSPDEYNPSKGSSSLSTAWVHSANIMGDSNTEYGRSNVSLSSSSSSSSPSSSTDRVPSHMTSDVDLHQSVGELPTIELVEREMIQKDSTLDLSSYARLEEGGNEETESTSEELESTSEEYEEKDRLPNESNLVELGDSSMGSCSWLKGSVNYDEDLSETTRLSAIHQLDTINLQDFLGERLTNIETSMTSLGRLPLSMTPLQTEPKTKTHSVEEVSQSEEPLPSSSSWSPAHRSHIQQEQELFSQQASFPQSVQSKDVINHGVSYLSTGSLESETTIAVNRYNSPRHSGSDKSRSPNDRSPCVKSMTASPSVSSLKDSTVTGGLLGVSMTRSYAMSPTTSFPHSNTNKPITSPPDRSFSPSRDYILASHAPLSASTQRTMDSPMPPSPIVYKLSDHSGTSEPPEFPSAPTSVVKRGVMEFDMGQKRDDTARSKANSFLERSQARAREAKEVARVKASISPTDSPVDSPISNRTNDKETDLTPPRTTTEVLASRLAQGNDRAEKVPMKEARSRSSRLYKELPEVVAARKKEEEAREKAERVAQAKADDRARRLSSAEKSKRSKRGGK